MTMLADESDGRVEDVIADSASLAAQCSPRRRPLELRRTA